MYYTKQARMSDSLNKENAQRKILQPKFLDHRTEATTQLQQQHLMAASPQVAAQQSLIQKMSQKLNSPLQQGTLANSVIQAKTELEYGGLKTFSFQNSKMSKPVTGEVGTCMKAKLDPKDPRTGTDTGGSNAYNDLFRALQTNTASTWVRGHLLNHDLGGVAHYNNLFPLTTAANGEHYQEVEKQVKHWVANNNDVHYEVWAYQEGTEGGGKFDCLAYPTKGKHKGDRIKKTIVSTPVKVDSTQVYKYKDDKPAKKFSSVVNHIGNNVERDKYKKESYKTSSSWKHKGGTVGVNNKSLDSSIDATDMQINFSGDDVLNEAQWIEESVASLIKKLEAKGATDIDEEFVEELVTGEPEDDWVTAYLYAYPVDEDMESTD